MANQPPSQREVANVKLVNNGSCGVDRHMREEVSLPIESEPTGYRDSKGEIGEERETMR